MNPSPHFNAERAWDRIRTKQKQAKRKKTMLRFGVSGVIMITLFYVGVIKNILPPSSSTHLHVSSFASNTPGATSTSSFVAPITSNKKTVIAKDISTTKDVVAKKLPQSYPSLPLFEFSPPRMDPVTDTALVLNNHSSPLARLPQKTFFALPHDSLNPTIITKADKFVLRVPTQSELHPAQKSYFARIIKELAQNY